MSSARFVGEKKGQAKSSCSDVNFTDCNARASAARTLWVARGASYIAENSVASQKYVIEIIKSLLKNWLKGIR